MEETHPQLKVSDIIFDIPKSWNIQKMQKMFDEESIAEIKRIPLPSFSRSQDKAIWIPST